MDPSLDILFYIGIIVPTTITIGFFIGFLVCWFQCDLKKKLIEARNKRHQKGKTTSKSAETEEVAGEKMEKASQHSADSAIDVNDLETAVPENTTTVRGDKPQTHNLPAGPFVVSNDNCFRAYPQPWHQTGMEVLTEAEIHTSLSRGAYPSHEKLNDEIHSEPRIYECQEDIELAMYNGLAPAHQYHNIRSQQPQLPLSTRSYLYKPNPHTSTRRDVRRQHPQQAYYHSAPRLLTNKRTSYSSSIGIFEDNHTTDYGFAPWQQRPNSVCAMRAGSISSSTGFCNALSIARPKYAPSNLSWKGNVPDNYSCEILHV